MKRSTQYLCEDGDVIARLKIKEEVAWDASENAAIDRVMDAAMGQLYAKLTRREIKCEGRCLECDDCDCLVSIDPNLRSLVQTYLFGFIQNGVFKQQYKAILPATVVDISCSCEPRKQFA